MAEKQGTKLCKHCKTEIPKGAKICPNCKNKQGGALKWVIIGIVALAIIGGSSGGKDSSNSDSSIQASGSVESSSSRQETASTPKPTPEPTVGPEIEYISVTADELSDALSNNAMKAQNDYKGQYIEVTGSLGTIDSNGKYIGIDSSKDFDFTNIQCYLKTDEQKEIIMEMSKGDTITVKGYCKDIGEIIGYQIDIDEVIK